MFQRLKGELKGAFDTIADEQNRLRQQQQSSNSAGRTSDSQTRPRQPRSRPAISGFADSDPDPAQFVVGDDTPTLTPDTSLVKGPVLESEDTNGSIGDETSGGPTASDGIIQRNEASDMPMDSPAEIQAKLKRLSKLETKYQDLLGAYRRAHARNSFIEPFEARLRESTPLTSINDPSAFVEYISQLSTKGDLVMNELKRVSEDKVLLKHKLDEAEKKTREAHDELARLHEKPREPMSSPTLGLDTIATVNSASTPPLTSSTSLSLGRSLFSPKQKPTTSTQESSDEMFSVEDEVPKLQTELQQRNERIEQLGTANESLQSDLASAQESTQQMMHNLEKAQRNLETTQQDLDAVEMSASKKGAKQQTEIASLQGLVSDLGVQVTGAQADLQTARTSLLVMTESRKKDLLRIGELEAHVKNLEDQESTLKSRIQDLSQYRESEDMAEAPPKQLEGPLGTEKQTEDDAAMSRKKKTKKRKKKVGLSHPEDDVTPQSAVQLNGRKKISPDSETQAQTLPSEFAALLKEKDVAIDSLHAKLKAQEDLAEEIENLRDELLHIGQEHVEAKDKIVLLEREREQLQERIRGLEEQIQDFEIKMQTQNELQTKANEATSQMDELQAEKALLSSRISSLEGEAERNQAQTSVSLTSSTRAYDDLMKSFEELRFTSKSLETDLSAAQALAASRYKEMTALRVLVQRAQPELTSLRTEVSELKTSRDDIAAKYKDVRKLELREESLRSELENLKKDASSKESEIKSLNQKVSQETSSRIAAEETNRRAQRDIQRANSERDSATRSRDTTSTELSQARSQLDDSRNRLQQLGRQVEQLTSDTDVLRDEISIKTAQHASAESLMSSIRDQAAEMAMQMREVQERCENLEEELQDAHRLMGERAREGETMRRLLSEVGGRAESRVQEMRERMEMAVQERDRAEDEAASVGRRRTREVEELKGRMREVEREVRRVNDDKGDLERIERDLRRQKEDGDVRTADSTRELEEVRRAMSELRDALDDGEKQIRTFEEERVELKRSLDEAQGRLEKLQKSNKTLSEDLRNLRATRIRPTDSPSQSSRSSFDSARRVTSSSPVPSTVNSSRGMSQSATNGQAVDFVYLKNVLLQFLEQRDKAHQMQLVPVLSMLLRFDKKDEQKWNAAISAR